MSCMVWVFREKIPRKFLIRNTKFYKNTSDHVKTNTLCLYLEQELHIDGMFCKACVPLGDISPIKMYCCNFSLSYIFVKSQVIYSTQKADFDLQPTSAIYTRCKADESSQLTLLLSLLFIGFVKFKAGTVPHSSLK